MANWTGVEFDTSSNERIELVAKIERRLRIEALLNLESELNGFKVRQLTIEDCLKFDYADNKIFTGGVPDESDFAHFFITLKSDKEKRSDKQIVTQVAKKYKTKTFIKSVYRFVDYAYNDLPTGGKSKGNVAYEADPKVWLGGIIDCFGLRI